MTSTKPDFTATKHSLCQQILPTLISIDPLEMSCLGNHSGVGGEFPKTSLVLVEHATYLGYIPSIDNFHSRNRHLVDMEMTFNFKSIFVRPSEAEFRK